MKLTPFLLTIAIGITLLFPTGCIAQEKTVLSLEDIRLRDIAIEIMRSARYCALITVDENGQPRARTMDPFPPEEDLIVWFGTTKKSRKVKQLSDNKMATLYYQDPEQKGYVSIHGQAVVVDDPIEKSKRWKDEWKDFYPNREEDYVLIKVIPKWIELISYKDGIYGDSITWQPPGVILNDLSQRDAFGID